jgi:hypothetical protein
LAKVAAMAAAVDTVPPVLAVVAEPVDIRAPAEMAELAELAVTLDKTVLVEPAAAAAAATTLVVVTQLPAVAEELAFTAKAKMEPVAQVVMALLLITERRAPEVATEPPASVGTQGCMVVAVQVCDQEAHLP